MIGCSKDEAEAISGNSILIEVEAPRTNGWSTEENVGTRSNKTIKEEGKDGLDMEVSTQSDSNTQTEQVTTRWSNLEDGIIFRVIAYKCTSATDITTTNYAGYGDYQLSGATVKTIKSLALPVGTYTFICYSYGSSAAIAAFANSSTSISATNGQNFMTCVKPNITINNLGSKYTLSDIVFIHQCVQYRILAKAQSGRMGNITACSGTLTLPNNSMTYSFTNDVCTTNKVAGNLNISWNSSNAMSAYSNYVYILPVNSQNIAISLNPTIGGKAFNGKSTTLSNLAFIKNKLYYSTISFTTTQGYILRGAFWAGGNLYYNGSFGFYGNMYDTNPDRGLNFWRWGSLYPTGAYIEAPTWPQSNDPCRKVSPADNWRLPTTTEYASLIKGSTAYTTLNSKIGLLIDNMLFFPATGYFAGANPDIIVTPTRGLYWAQGRGTMLDFVVNVYNPMTNGSDHADNFMVIRCVRAD